MLPDPGQPAAGQSSTARPASTLPAGPVRRIVVVGNCGSGKSTLSPNPPTSTALADRLGLPLVYLDRHYWGRDGRNARAEYAPRTPLVRLTSNKQIRWWLAGIS